MLIIKVENIDKAIKTLKKKFEKTKVVSQLRERKFFTKKSVKRREQIKKAIYLQTNICKQEHMN